MTKLALARYNENITRAADRQRQRHRERQAGRAVHATATPAPGTDGDHGVAANLPAEVNTFYNLWLPKTLDNGVWAAAGGRDLRDDQLPQQQDDDEHRGDRLLVERQHDDEHDGVHHVPHGHHERGQRRRV